MPLPTRTTTVQPDPVLAAEHDEAGARLADAMRARYGPDWHAARSGAVGRLPMLTADPDDGGHWHTVHIVVKAPDVPSARSVAHIVATMAAEHPLVVRGATTVSCELEPDARHAVYCDATLPGVGRCVRLSEHLGDHSPTEQSAP